MLKETVTITNPFTNEPVEKDMYFHLTKADMIRIIASTNSEDWDSHVKALAETKSVSKLLELLEDLILTAYGIRTSDNEFLKNHEVKDKFRGSEEYGELVEKILTDVEGFGAQFFAGLNPEVADQSNGTKDNVRKIGNRQQRRDRNKKDKG